MKKLLLLLLLPLAAFAQNTKVVPDCVIPFNFTTTASTGNLTCGAPNGNPNSPGIASWIVVYDSTGFSALSLVVQSAPDSAGFPGIWATFAGTVLSNTQYPGSSGINPNTATTSAFTGFAGYYPWMRVTLASISGTGRVKGNLYGFLNSTLAKAGSGGSGGGGPTIAGTANQITVTGAGCTSPSTATCTISFPNAFVTIDPTTGNVVTPGSVTSGLGSGTTGAFDLKGKTSGATSTITVDDNNTATNVKLPNDATSGLYAVTTTSATPAAGCAQFDGISTEATSTSTPCGAGGGGAAGATLFSTTGSTTVTATSPTTLIGAGTGSTTVAANTFTAGQVLEVAAQGYYSTPGTAVSLTITLNIGGTSRITTGVVLQQASVNTDVWRLRCIVTTRTSGASGTQIANCIFEETGSAPYPQGESMQTSATWTIDTTATQVLDLVATWSTAVGAPTITSTNVAAWIPGAPVTSVNTQTGAVSLFTTNAQTATYQVLAADFVGCKTVPVASGTFTITLVASGSQPPSGQCITILNYGTGVVTLARSGQNINGAAANLTGTAGSATAPTGWYVVSDGTNYVANVLGGGTGGGTTVTAAAPYLEIGSTFYVARNMAPATKPTSPTYLNSVACSSTTTAANGDIIFQNTTTIQCFGGYTATASIEADLKLLPSGGGVAGGIWLWDSTNNKIYVWMIFPSAGNSPASLSVFVYSYNGTGNPSFSSFNQFAATDTAAHIKITLSGTTLIYSASANGGLNFTTYTTSTGIGTISKGGVVMDGIGAIDVYSLVVL